MRKKPDTFKKLRVGQKVWDRGYGPGKVIKKTARRALIQLEMERIPWNYDVEHIQHFIRIGKQIDAA